MQVELTKKDNVSRQIITAIALSAAHSPIGANIPALSTKTSKSFSTAMWFIIAAAIALLQVFPVHTNKIFFADIVTLTAFLKHK